MASVEQLDWTLGATTPTRSDAHLVLAFGGSSVFAARDVYAECRVRFPDACIAGCSTAGEIHGTHVRDDSLSITAVRFSRGRVRLASTELRGPSDSRDAGNRIACELATPGLVHVLVLSDGIAVNGTDLVTGLVSRLGAGVSVSGGLAGDGARMERTVVMAQGAARSGVIAGIGLYGPGVEVRCGCRGGWDPFGPERVVTRAESNVLYELDHASALDLYVRYLGPHAAGLPATGLLFPLSVRAPGATESVVRTILGVDRATQSIRFAGDIPVGHYARLMKANFDRIIDGASGAAQMTRAAAGASPELALLVSCVGRKLVLGQRVEEEVEGVRDVLGAGCAIAGFYSNGEISQTGVRGCELHNQTMTITTLHET